MACRNLEATQRVQWGQLAHGKLASLRSDLAGDTRVKSGESCSAVLMRLSVIVPVSRFQGRRGGRQVPREGAGFLAKHPNNSPAQHQLAGPASL
jgi:hypothetical protein